MSLLVVFITANVDNINKICSFLQVIMLFYALIKNKRT